MANFRSVSCGLAIYEHPVSRTQTSTRTMRYSPNSEGTNGVAEGHDYLKVADACVEEKTVGKTCGNDFR